ncbi:hypothetical protein MMC18_001186 [Xylographa bjoerkii]|nr:hypothetical protein [Xylographa bjoerkii]
MSVQVTTGYGSLFSLGFGIGDIMTLITMARRKGNWLTASSGDVDFLEMLEQDEMSLLRRGGSVDMARFNKIWGRKLRTLMDNQPQAIEGPQAEEALGQLSRLEAYMTCIVAVLDEFAAERTAKLIVRLLLKQLLRTTERGDDLLASQFSNRLGAWRSNATARGLTVECQSIRTDLVTRQIIQPGLMPHGESEAMAKSLYWLLAESTDHFVTNSSDVVGVMICLEHLGFDILSVVGPGLDPDPPERACRVTYAPFAISGTENARFNTRIAMLLLRLPSTIVSLMNPQESLTTFPIDGLTANRCRLAWKEGAKSVQCLEIQVDIPDSARIKYAHDFRYKFVDRGTKVERTDEGVFKVVFAHALITNQEICQRLRDVLCKESEDVLNWVCGQTDDPISTNPRIEHYYALDKKRTEAFTVFQAFFMGYYYAIFLTIVYTSTLEMQTVDGGWGYGSAGFLATMRRYCRNSVDKGLSRQEVI